MIQLPSELLGLIADSIKFEKRKELHLVSKAWYEAICQLETQASSQGRSLAIKKRDINSWQKLSSALFRLGWVNKKKLREQLDQIIQEIAQIKPDQHDFFVGLLADSWRQYSQLNAHPVLNIFFNHPVMTQNAYMYVAIRAIRGGEYAAWAPVLQQAKQENEFILDEEVLIDNYEPLTSREHQLCKATISQCFKLSDGTFEYTLKDLKGASLRLIKNINDLKFKSWMLGKAN